MDDDEFEDLLGEVALLPDTKCLFPTSSDANTRSTDLLDIDTSMLDFSADDAYNGQHDQPDLDAPSAELPMFDGDQEDVLPEQEQRTLQKPYPNAAIIDKIEAVFESVTDALLNDRPEISITLKTRVARRKRATTSASSREQTRQLSFPGKTEDEAWRFSVVIRIMEIMHEALRNDVVLSKRDIFYRDPALFGSQAQVDRYVDDIALTFGVPRASLNVTAVAKGLFAGALKLHRRDGSVIAADTDQEGLLVPNLKDILSADMRAVKWILVIEKEATFRSIAASDFWNVAITEGVLLTGKGYPDLSSRAFLHFLSTPSPRNGFAPPAVFGLADFDPDGIAILSTYQNGSKALAHESAAHSVPSLQWLGLRSEHLNIGGEDTQAAQGLLSLTPRDRKKANDMLEQPGLDSIWRHELQTMLMLNTKAELQLLDAIPSGMANLLNSTLDKL